MFKIIMSIFLMLLLFGSCNGDVPLAYCEKLKKTLEKRVILTKLESWFDKTFEAKLLIEGMDYQLGGVFIHGDYTYRKPFDWSILNFDQEGIIKIIKLQKVGNQAKIESVYLGERGRYGVLVKSKESTEYGIGSDAQYMTKLSDRTAVYVLIMIARGFSLCE